MLIAKVKTWNRKHRGVAFAFEILAVLFLFALVAGYAGDVKADNTKLYLGGYSVHYQHNQRYNNNNWGIYVEHQRVVIGGYKNSFGNWTGLAAYNMEPLGYIGPVRVGWSVGAALGYKQQPVIVAPALTFTVDRVRVVATPYVSTLVVNVARW